VIVLGINADCQIEKCATIQQWLEDQLARQSEKAKNVNPIITSSEINKRKEDVVYTCAAIMNRPKPKPKVTDSTPASGQQTPKEEPKKDDKMDVEEGGPSIEEMDVD
jgi:heat shock 70kDa protein 4